MTPRIHYHTDCPSFAGCENMLANLLASPLIRERFDVSLSYRASMSYTEGLARRVRLDFPVYPLRYPEPSGVVPAPRWAPPFVRRILRVLSRLVGTAPLFCYQVWLLRRLFAKLRPDILHINNGGYPAALSARTAAIAGRLAGVPHILMVVNNLTEEYHGPWQAIRRAVDRAVIASVSTFVTGSVAATQRLRDVLEVDEQHSAAYPNGIALRPVTETREEALARAGLANFAGVVFGTVAILELRKGHRVLFEAVSRLVHGPGGPPFSFIVLLVGEGTLRHELELMAKTEGLLPHCIFVGHEAHVMNLIAALDVLVLPSISDEDFPNVILEAMGMAKPVIASRVAGTPEQVVDGVTGCLVPPADAAALAAAMTRIGSDAALRDRMGVAGRGRFQECFTADVSVRRYVTQYQSFVEPPEIA